MPNNNASDNKENQNPHENSTNIHRIHIGQVDTTHHCMYNDRVYAMRPFQESDARRLASEQKRVSNEQNLNRR